MPELPEVEKVRRDLEAAWPGTSTIVRLQFFRKDLRYPLPSVAKRRALEGLGPVQFGRRGKFLVWDFPGLHIVSHLGMSGSWRWRVEGEKRGRAAYRIPPKYLFAFSWFDDSFISSSMRCRILAQ